MDSLTSDRTASTCRSTSTTNRLRTATQIGSCRENSLRSADRTPRRRYRLCSAIACISLLFRLDRFALNPSLLLFSNSLFTSPSVYLATPVLGGTWLTWLLISPRICFNFSFCTRSSPALRTSPRRLRHSLVVLPRFFADFLRASLFRYLRVGPSSLVSFFCSRSFENESHRYCSVRELRFHRWTFRIRGSLPLESILVPSPTIFFLPRPLRRPLH